MNVHKMFSPRDGMFSFFLKNKSMRWGEHLAESWWDAWRRRRRVRRRRTEDKRVCERWFISPGIYGSFFSDGLCILAMDHGRAQSAGSDFKAQGYLSQNKFMLWKVFMITTVCPCVVHSFHSCSIQPSVCVCVCAINAPDSAKKTQRQAIHSRVICISRRDQG